MKQFAVATFALFLSISFAFSQRAVPGILFVKTTEKAEKRIRSGDAHSLMGSKRFQKLQVNSFSGIINDLNSARKKTSHGGDFKSDISRIFKITYSASIPPTEAAAMISQMQEFEFVEPNYIFDVLYVPNDTFAQPDLGISQGQNHIIVHDFYKAWDVTKGDTNVVMGIIDTGIDFNQEDLKDQIYINYNDPVNGLNDDGDAFYWGEDTFAYYTDNWRGWDVADWDNDPSNAPGISHGTEVAGIAGAHTNNGVGIAGTGHDCQLMAIKGSKNEDPLNISGGYDGILVAATTGVDIANLSWGGPGALPQLFQDLVNFAVLDMDVVVIAAAGNSGGTQEFYPAALENVLAVTGVRYDTSKQGLSQYNYDVDIAACGWHVKTTSLSVNGEDTTWTYVNHVGTSVAAPVVTGAAGLLKSHRPELSAIQIMEQLRVSGTVIDTMPVNLPYKHKIGKLLNPYRALTDSLIPSIRVISWVADDHDGNTWMQSDTGMLDMAGDSLWITLNLTNHLANTDSLIVKLVSVNGDFEVIDSIYAASAVLTFDTVSNEANPFALFVPASNQEKDTLLFRIEYADSSYDDYQYFKLYYKPTLISGNALVKTIDPQAYIYPNPTSGTFNIQLDASINEHLKINIVDQNGISVKKLSAKAIQGAVTIQSKALALKKGIYVVRIEGKSISESIQLTKL